MKNVAIILQDLRSGGSERFASRLSLLLSEKFNVYVLVFDASEKRFDCAGEFVDLGLPAGKDTVKRAVIMLKRAAAIRKFVKEHDICTAYSFTHAPKMQKIYLLPRLRKAYQERKALFFCAAPRVQYSL